MNINNEHYYYHNIKASVSFKVDDAEPIEWLQKGKGEFSFVRKLERYRTWKNAFYFPIVVLRNGKPWGSFDPQRFNVHIITRGNFESQVNTFLSILKESIPEISIISTRLKYVEICTRYDDRYFEIVTNSIKKAEARFFTTDKKQGFDKRVKGKNYITLAPSLFIDRSILNIKTYRFVENFNARRMKISESIRPKIEVQINNPRNLIEAKNEAIPLIKAFQEHIGFETLPMIEPEYCLIHNTQSLRHNTQLINCLKEKYAPKVVKFPKEITQDDLTHTIACFITPEAKSTNEILAHVNVSPSTLHRRLKILEPYLEKRGHKGIGIYYQIDTNLLEQHYDNNKPKKRLFTKDRDNKPPKSTSITTNQEQLAVSTEVNNPIPQTTHNNIAYRLIYLPSSTFVLFHFVRVSKSLIRLIHKSSKSIASHRFISQHIAVFIDPMTRDINPSSN